MDRLIDLNSEPELEQDSAYETPFEYSGDTSVLRRRMPIDADYRIAGFTGALL